MCLENASAVLRDLLVDVFFWGCVLDVLWRKDDTWDVCARFSLLGVRGHAFAVVLGDVFGHVFGRVFG